MSWKSLPEYALAAVADFLAPDTCHLCGALYDDGLVRRFALGARARALTVPTVHTLAGLELRTHPICACCAGGLREAQTPAAVDGIDVHSPFITDEALLRIIRVIKFSRYAALATGAAAAIACALEDTDATLGDRPLLVPVPMDRRSLRRRGFNQSEKIAVDLGRTLGVRTGFDVIVKRHRTPPQSLTALEARHANVCGAFVAVSRLSRGADAIIVDDIVTSGATVIACATALKDAGARSVSVVCFGRSSRLDTAHGPHQTLFLQS